MSELKETDENNEKKGKTENDLEAERTKITSSDTQTAEVNTDGIGDQKNGASKFNWSKITDSQAVIIGALITSILALIVSFVNLYSNRQQEIKLESIKNQHSIELENIKGQQAIEIEKIKKNLIDKGNLIDDLKTSRQEAIISMQEIKDALGKIIDDVVMPFSEAKGLLSTSSQNLVVAHRKFTANLTTNNPSQKEFGDKFHNAKNVGLLALRNLMRVQQPETEPISEDVRNALVRAKEEISNIREELRKDYIKVDEK